MKGKLPVVLLTLLLMGSVSYNFYQLRRGSAGSESSASAKQVWTCGMDPQVIQDHPGKCPICGMNLTLQEQGREPATMEKLTADAPAEENYQCPMHPAIVQDHPGDCPACGMKLVKMKGSTAETEKSDGSMHRVSYYRSPMDPKQTSMVPRKDEMGMDYLPVYETDGSGKSGVEGRSAVVIDPTRQQLIGLRTATATPGEVGGSWQTVGRVEIDPTNVRKINIKVSGYVERIFVDFVGKPVKRGEPLFTLYSPELLVAQQEFLLALKSGNPSGAVGDTSDAVTAAARRKLLRWDVPSAEIERLEQTGEAVKSLTFTSPVTGVVTAKNVVEGAAVEPGDTPYEVTDLNTVWVLADAYQPDLARVKTGMRASMAFESVPDRVFIGKVAFIDPMLDSRSRTLKVRINVQNDEGELKPGMYGEVMLRGESREGLTIPADALIPSGRGYFVFVAIGDGRFEPRVVTLGEQAGGVAEVLKGLDAGEAVVTRANFLVDSESSLRAALAAVEGN